MVPAKTSWRTGMESPAVSEESRDEAEGEKPQSEKPQEEAGEEKPQAEASGGDSSQTDGPAQGEAKEE